MERLVEDLFILSKMQNPDFEIENGDIDFNNVNFAYKKGSKKYVLQNIDLHIKSGETIGIIGGTGSSKSSLVNLISRLYDVSEGSVFVGGKDVRSYDIETLRNEVSVVLQKNVLFSGTIKENITYGNIDATYEEIKKACINACAFDFINELDDKFDTVLGEKGFGLSEGQAQRISIARSFLRTRPILILDEATSALDAKTEISVLKSIKNLEHKPTCIIITHRPGALAICDRILRLEDGNLIEESKDFAFEVASDLV